MTLPESVIEAMARAHEDALHGPGSWNETHAIWKAALCKHMRAAVALIPEPGPVDFDVVREALTNVEDAASRSPWSTDFWPNGTHPNAGVEKLRDALAALFPIIRCHD